MKHSHAIAFLAVLATTVTQAAEIRDPCNKCGANEYLVWFEQPAPEKTCETLPPYSWPSHACRGQNFAPTTVLIECNSYHGPTATCTAWPTGKNITYAWSGALGLSFTTATNKQSVGLSCTRFGTMKGVVNVTVTSPYGVSAIETVEIGCGAPGF